MGGQNFLEPAAQGTHVVTGPYLNDFAWVGEDIFSQGIVTKCNTWQAVAQTMVSQLKNPNPMEMEKSILKQKAWEYIKNNQGGTSIGVRLALLSLFKTENCNK